MFLFFSFDLSCSGPRKSPEVYLTPGHMACLCLSKHQHRIARREASLIIAVAILRARELSIRQHIMLLTVILIELYIFHASFRVDGESISVLTYYVNRFLKYFLYFLKLLILLSCGLFLQPDFQIIVQNIQDKACSSAVHRGRMYDHEPCLHRSVFRPCRPEAG